MKRVTKTSSYGIIPKNAEQSFALDAIMNPDIKLVTVQGVAGTGKTLLSLAGALEQRRNYPNLNERFFRNRGLSTAYGALFVF